MERLRKLKVALERVSRYAVERIASPEGEVDRFEDREVDTRAFPVGSDG